MLKKYVKPELVNLGDALPEGLGQCDNGSVANRNWLCITGSGVIGYSCRNGAIASDLGSPNCSTGSTP